MDRKIEQSMIDKESFGPLWEYIIDKNITDVDINNGVVWIRDINLRRINTGMVLDSAFMNFFTNKVANLVSGKINPTAPVLESETATLRFSVIHESSTMTGRSICIRKTLPEIRLTEKAAVEQKYLSEKTLHFLANCVKAKMTVIIGGEVGVGKTECIKFLSRYIGDTERVCTIEDSAELHYKEIYPERDCVALKVTNTLTYSAAIKATLRQDVSRIILSEARSSEAKDLIECMSNGMSGISTLHTDDIRNIPSRFLNMMSTEIDADRLANDVYTYLDVGILLRAKQMPDGRKYRYMDQVGIYVDVPENKCEFIVKSGEMVKDVKLPQKVVEKFSAAGIKDPFVYEEGLHLK